MDPFSDGYIEAFRKFRGPPLQLPCQWAVTSHSTSALPESVLIVVFWIVSKPFCKNPVRRRYISIFVLCISITVSLWVHLFVSTLSKNNQHRFVHYVPAPPACAWVPYQNSQLYSTCLNVLADRRDMIFSTLAVLWPVRTNSSVRILVPYLWLRHLSQLSIGGYSEAHWESQHRKIIRDTTDSRYCNSQRRIRGRIGSPRRREDFDKAEKQPLTTSISGFPRTNRFPTSSRSTTSSYRPIATTSCLPRRPRPLSSLPSPSPPKAPRRSSSQLRSQHPSS